MVSSHRKQIYQNLFWKHFLNTYLVQGAGCSGSSFQLKALLKSWFEPLKVEGNVQDTIRKVTVSSGFPACGLRLLLAF